jgi:energy-coupling factor transporter transmembrane protein EcfT
MSESGWVRLVERDSLLHRADPISKSLVVVVVAVGSILFATFVPIAILLVICLFVAAVLGHVPLKTIWGSAGMIATIGLCLGVFHAFVDPGQALVHLGPASITKQGVLLGLIYFFRLSLVVLVSLMLTWTTDIHDLMVGLVHVKVPYRLAFAIFAALRFVPVVSNEVDAVRAAHSIRGRAARNPIANASLLWQRYLFAVLVNSLRKGEELAVAAECRGFGLAGIRTNMKPFAWSRSGLVLIAFFIVAIVVLKVWDQTTLVHEIYRGLQLRHN